VIGNVLVVEDKWDKFGPYHFIVDTGSSVTLVSPDLAKRYASEESPPRTTSPRCACARPRAATPSSTP
jgi:hypothetical protein